MGIFDKVFGKRETSPEERSDKSLAALTIAMATFNGGITLGEALKRKKIPKNKRTKRIKIAFAFGAFDFFAGENRMTIYETKEAFEEYINDEYKKDSKELVTWFNKNINKKNFEKIMQIGGQSIMDLIKQRLKNQIILFTILNDKKYKL
jgi:hypothetical protein